MDALNTTGASLFLAAGDEPNLAMSPLSIGLAFGMLHAGATGRVREAIERLYPFPPDASAALERLVTQVSRDFGDELPAVTVANGAFVADEFTLLADYAATLREHFAAVIASLPMRTDADGSRAAIDAWISERTRGLIERIIPEDLPREDTRLILVNTVYFKAKWELPFNGQATPRPFLLEDGTESTADLMFEGGAFEFARSDAWDAVRLPYGGGLEMLVVVPAAGRFAQVQERLAGSLIDDLDAALTPGQVFVGLPKFTAEAKVDLEAVITRGLGIHDLFGIEGLDGIGPRLAVDAAIHAAKVIVDEDGTEAAAATVVAVRAMSMPVYDAEIIADRPFIYAIRDTATKAVLFIGRFTDPRA